MARNFVAASNDFIDFGNPAVLDLTGDEVTLSLWVRLDSSVSSMKVFAKWSGAGMSYLLEVLTNGHVLFGVSAGGIDITEGTTDLDDGLWHHIAGTYDGSDIRIYVDGVEENSTAASGNLTSTTEPVYIGSRSNGGNPFDGDAGHAMIDDRGWSPQEVASLAAGASPLQFPTPVFYAPLNGQSPEIDVIGGIAGTVTGTTVVEEPPIPHSIVAP